MIFLTNVFSNTMNQVWHTFSVNWIYLLVSAIIAALLKIYADPERVSAFLRRYRNAGVLAATAAAVGTPLCSCGTTAVILGMLAGMMPWAPIVAFMVASPLTSPQELIYSAGLFGWPFALTFFGASIVLGLAGGLVAGVLESRGWLDNQFRMPMQELVPAPSGPLSRFSTPVSACCSPAVSGITETGAAVSAASCCSISAMMEETDRILAGQPVREDARSVSTPKTAVRPSLQEFLNEVWFTGTRLLMMFLIFAFVGYFLNGLIPAAWVKAVFGSGNVYSVPLAATLGLPLYVNTEASLPLVRAMLDSGMSQGAALAFLITGAGTSFGALAGALTIARWRVIAIVIGTLWVGAMIFGFAYDLLLVV